MTVIPFPHPVRRQPATSARRAGYQMDRAAVADGRQRFREELAAAPTRNAATDVCYTHDHLFLGLSCDERERRYAEIEDTIREKPEDSHCQVRVSVPAPSGKHTEREIQ